MINTPVTESKYIFHSALDAQKTHITKVLETEFSFSSEDAFPSLTKSNSKSKPISTVKTSCWNEKNAKVFEAPTHIIPVIKKTAPLFCVAKRTRIKKIDIDNEEDIYYNSDDNDNYNDNNYDDDDDTY